MMMRLEAAELALSLNHALSQQEERMFVGWLAGN